MLRESEIANFLDLIKHITEARNFKNTSSVPKSKKRDRYENSVHNDESLPSQKNMHRNSLAIIESQQKKPTQRKNEIQFEHKMLKITHEIKRKPKSFKMDSFYDEDKSQFQSDTELGKKVSLARSSLYQNYCEMIQRKRQQRITKMFRSSQQQINQNICNISDTVNFDNGAQNIKTFKQSPFIKSKTLKPGLQNIKIKHFKQPKSKTKQKSKKKMYPQQLNIQSLKSVKMPKLENANKRKLFKIQKHVSPYAKKTLMNKIGNLQGWAQQDEEKNCFNIQYF